MQHFPVTNSTLSAKQLQVFLQERYPLSKKAECKFIRAGINDTYVITDGAEKFIFRIYSLGWRTQEEINEEIGLLLTLKQNDIPVSYPLPDNNNNYTQTLHAPEGDRLGVLFSYAHGQKMHIFSQETHYNIGKLMAKFHQVTNNQNINRVSYSPQMILIDSLKQVGNFLDAGAAEWAYMQITQQYLLQQFKNADVAQMRTGIVHLDIWYDNLNIDDQGNVTLFDFDFCGNGWLCLDLAYYIMQLHNIEKYEPKDYQPKIDSFLKGYESITQLSPEEKRLIPMLGASLYFFYLGIQCQRYDNWSNTFLSENYLKRFINGLVRRYCEIYGMG